MNIFTMEGMFNPHNAYMWAVANRHVTQNRAAQRSFMVNSWAGIEGNYRIGPYLFPSPLTGANALTFVEQVLPKLLETYVHHR
ncbi:hypothetical protein AVEN_63498-1 [Araneus ventricosus]|uniref:Uncharacterized protein n=1 Tax=Araneus ventricosus TaxID=182803 RepID=A0A4Y2JME4_ARAVE|nr:hypothetical protein AVEN_63498-1 [Araneus ventricosus]